MDQGVICQQYFTYKTFHIWVGPSNLDSFSWYFYPHILEQIVELYGQGILKLNVNHLLGWGNVKVKPRTVSFVYKD